MSLVIMTEETFTHAPVLLKEVVEALVTDKNGFYLDGTLGLGGHAAALLEKLGAGGKLLGLDWDPEIQALAKEKLARFGDRFIAENANFSQVEGVLARLGHPQLAGSLFDLGIASFHLQKASRGFSLQKEGPLDMRLSPENPLTASAIVNEWPLEQIVHLLREYGEERHAFRIARAIIEQRRKEPFKTTQELAALIEKRVPRSGRIHPATRTFMALRIAVNRELENLTRGIEGAAAHTTAGGRIAVITFHSLEDRIVKHLFQSFVNQGQWRWIVRVQPPTAEETRENPRARSSKLRVVEKA